MNKHAHSDILNHGCKSNATEPHGVYRYSKALRVGGGLATAIKTEQKRAHRTELSQRRNI
ncbi:hypothetical protein GA0061093_11656 [Rhodococcus qingshengii]|nr:hypothetical protein GA0061093_11656 [Rhodococcus qingshengii]